MPAKKTKKKFTLEDLKFKSSKVDIVHPNTKEVVTWIEIIGMHSHAFIDASVELAENKDNLKTMADLSYARAKAFSTLIISWDVEVFGEFSEEAVIERFSDEGLSWMLDQVEEAANDVARFLDGSVPKTA